MKRSRNLSLVTVAAAAFLAFVGAGTASATQLCTDSGFGCTEYSGKIIGTSTNATLAASLANVVCEDSQATIFASSSTGAPILGEVSELTFSGCHTEVSVIPCTVTVKNLPYSTELEGKTLRVTDSVGAGAKVVCGATLSCEFLTTEMNFAITNGSPTTAKASAVPLSPKGTLCPPSTATWSATYSVTSPTGLTVL